MTKNNMVLLAYILKKMQKDTWHMLENDDYENAKTFSINYDGIKVNIPMDYAETNQDVEGFIMTLLECYKDYFNEYDI